MVHSTDVDESENFLARLTRFSEWHRLKRSIAWILRLKPKQNITDDGTKRGGNATKVEVKPLIVEELDRAEKNIFKLVERGAFPKEIGALQKIQRAYSYHDRHIRKGEEV